MIPRASAAAKRAGASCRQNAGVKLIPGAVVVLRYVAAGSTPAHRFMVPSSDRPHAFR
jgi:hypothetical protein